MMSNGAKSSMFPVNILAPLNSSRRVLLPLEVLYSLLTHSRHTDTLMYLILFKHSAGDTAT